MEKLIGILLGIFLLMLIIPAISACLAALVWLAWKEVAVPVFNAPSLTFFQCWLGMLAFSIVTGCFRRSSSK